MAGVKGRSGGPRPNSGGARPGAGRPRKAVVPIDALSPTKEGSKFAAQAAPKVASKKAIEASIVQSPIAATTKASLIPPMTAAEATACRRDPLEFLRAVWSGQMDASQTQIRAAEVALPFLHKKLGEAGKKEQKQDAAEKVLSRFAPVAAPKLVASNK
jgi:hypothetical protein